MKRIVILLLAMSFLLCGCRIRVIDSASRADTVLTPETEPPTEGPTEPTEAPTEPPTEEEARPAAEETAEAQTEPVIEEQPSDSAGPGNRPTSQPVSEAAPVSTEPPPTETEPEPSDPPETTPPDRLCTVTLDGNGHHVKGPNSTLELQIPTGAGYGELPTPPFEGYTFLGWFTAPDGGEQILPETPFPGVDLTLYAHWQYDPLLFWRFTLQNRTQQVYLCQQAVIYFETAEPNVTQANCSLISDMGGWNIASGRDDPVTTDDWVLAKNPEVIVKCVGSLSEADAVRAEILSRFPGRRVFLVTAGALGDGPAGLYARLYLAKALYGDWYLDVDLAAVAAELGVESPPIQE